MAPNSPLVRTLLYILSSWKINPNKQTSDQTNKHLFKKWKNGICDSKIWQRKWKNRLKLVILNHVTLYQNIKVKILRFFFRNNSIETASCIVLYGINSACKKTKRTKPNLMLLQYNHPHQPWQLWKCQHHHYQYCIAKIHN